MPVWMSDVVVPHGWLILARRSEVGFPSLLIWSIYLLFVYYVKQQKIENLFFCPLQLAK